MLNRVDTKFVFHISYLPEILEDIQSSYSMLEINGQRGFEYETLYFDTPEYDLYKFHHNGRTGRFKVRFRKYSDSGLCFFEVKYKTKSSRTNKVRLMRDEIYRELNGAELDMVLGPPGFDKTKLRPTMWVNFKRYTFAANNMDERATLDINVLFDNETKKMSFPELVIAELKTEKNSTKSLLFNALKKRHLLEVPFSKYSTAVAMLEPVKNNAFKPNILKVNKIINHGKRDY